MTGAALATTLVATVSHPIRAGAELVQTSVRWSYTAADPLALTLTWPDRCGGESRCLLTRNAVINAVLPGEYDDDVRVTALTLADEEVLVITLPGPTEQAAPRHLVFALDEVVDFLADTEALVALGAETVPNSTALATVTAAACAVIDSELAENGHRSASRPRSILA
jgi:hypothetical protein